MADAATRKTTRSTKLNFGDVAAYRRGRGENQSEFWRRFGVTQSGGSRYESGRQIPLPVRALLVMFAGGTISEAQLAAAMKAARKSRG